MSIGARSIEHLKQVASPDRRLYDCVLRLAAAAFAAAIFLSFTTSEAQAVTLACMGPSASNFAAILATSTYDEAYADGCPLPRDAQLVVPVAASSHVSVSGSTLTLSFDADAPTSEQIDWTFQEAQGLVSFLAPAATVTLAIDFSFYDNPSDPTFVSRVFASVDLTRDGGGPALVHLIQSAITSVSHQTVLVTGLTPGEQLDLGVSQSISWYQALPAGHIAQLSVTVVPEPATAPLLVSGLMTLAIARRRRP